MATNVPKDLLGQLIEFLADAVADRVVERLQGNDGNYVDQSTSPLGPRRHIAAIRSGKLPGVIAGRRYLARTADVEAFARGSCSDEPRRDPVDEIDELAVALGLGTPKSGG